MVNKEWSKLPPLTLTQIEILKAEMSNFWSWRKKQLLDFKADADYQKDWTEDKEGTYR